MPGLLENLTVLDLTSGTAGPITTLLLAELGADVIKVEPIGGDPLGGRYEEQYRVWDRGKKSMSLDLVDDEGRAILRRLLEESDVVVEVRGLGGLESLGLTAKDLHAQHERLVVCSISGWDPLGDQGTTPPYQSLVDARLGLQWRQRPDGSPEEAPTMPGWPGLAYGTAYQALVLISAALLWRDLTGRGEVVEMSYLDAHLGMSGMALTRSERGTPGLRLARLDWGDGEPVVRFITGHAKCSDGRYIQVHTGAAGSCDRLLQLLGMDNLLAPKGGSVHEFTRFFTGAEHERIREEAPRVIATRPSAEWIKELEAADIPCTPVRRMGEAVMDDQTEAMGMRVQVEDPTQGVLTQVGLPIKFGGVEAGSGRRGAPEPGQDSEAVLAALGFSASEIRDLVRRKIVNAG